MLEPPERNSSTLMPVSFSNMLATFWAVSIGTEQYQTTLPSRLAAAMSTGCAMAEPAAHSRVVPAIRPRRLSVPFAVLRFFRWLVGNLAVRLRQAQHGIAARRLHCGAAKPPLPRGENGSKSEANNEATASG